MSEDKQKGPIQTLRDGPLVVKLWEQQGPKGPYVTATLGRTYRNEQTGEYGESRSLGGADVLRAQALLGEANKEMIQWRDYYKEVERQMQPELASSEADAPKREQEPAQGLAAQRDAVLESAKQPSQQRERGRSPER